jgi:hypothetical protein
MRGRDWSEEDLRFLVRHWGTLTERQIARRLGRTTTAVDVKAKRMRLGPCRQPGSFTAREIEHLLSIDVHSVIRWQERGWLRAERRVTKGKVICVLVNVDDFEVFLREHPEAWDSRKAPRLWDAIRQKRFERDSAAWREPAKRELTPERREAFARFVLQVARDRAEAISKAREEPDWLIAKRVADMTWARRRFAKWTPQEDSQLRYLLTRTKLTVREIAAKMDRSCSAVEHRIARTKTLMRKEIAS